MVAKTPRTPGELFSHLTLNGPPSAVPTITLFPPTPPVELSMSPKVEQPGSARSMRSSPLAELLSSPSPTSSFGSPQSASSPATKTKINQAKLDHRRLASNEARQLTLLLTQHLWPVRTNAKGLMKESISLAEKLHEAGIRWDKHRRVMGMHLKGGSSSIRRKLRLTSRYMGRRRKAW